MKRLLTWADVGPDHLVVEIGAGRGALTEGLAAAGAEVWAVEPDPVWIEQAQDRIERAGLADRVRWIPAPFERLRLPRTRYRVVANLPYASTTAIMAGLFDRPERGPDRADLLVQREVADKHAATPARALRTAAWAPWWTFEPGPVVDRRAFRPVPSVDGRVLTVRRRPIDVLPTDLATDFRETLRPTWESRRPG